MKSSWPPYAVATSLLLFCFSAYLFYIYFKYEPQPITHMPAFIHNYKEFQITKLVVSIAGILLAILVLTKSHMRQALPITALTLNSLIVFLLAWEYM